MGYRGHDDCFDDADTGGDEYDLSLVHQTDDAWLVSWTRRGMKAQAWLPKSRCLAKGGDEIEETITLWVPDWLAEEKGLA